MSEAGVKSAFLGYRSASRLSGNICSSLKHEVVHGIGSQRDSVWRRGEARHRHYFRMAGSDNATTVPVGIIDERTDELLVPPKTRSARDQVLMKGTVGDICGRNEDEAPDMVFSVVNAICWHGVGAKCMRNPKSPITANAAADQN